MTRVYVAGPLRGYARWNFDAFAEAAAVLRAAGYEVISPAEHDIEGGFDPEATSLDGFDLKAAFRWELEQVMAADAVVVLEGWRASKGATAEVKVAQAIGTPVWTLEACLSIAEWVTAGRSQAAAPTHQP